MKTSSFPDAAETEFLSSPALRVRKPGYPARFEGRVPRVVRTKHTVRADFPAFAPAACVAPPTDVFLAWTNSYGAVAAITPGGNLGLKPHEFEVVEWADLSKLPLAGDPHG